MRKTEISSMRKNYQQRELLESAVESDAMKQFEVWFLEAISAKVSEPNAMVLSTIDYDGYPDSRVILLKGFDVSGFEFYTNYNSGKGFQLEVSGRAALNFFWVSMERQIRIQGNIKKVSMEKSDKYFKSRPHGSRLGAWASDQSRVIASRELLESRLRDLEQQYEGDEFIPRPPHWGGFLLEPFQVEFWQGRPNRLHDRLRYTKSDGVGWQVDRLSP